MSYIFHYITDGLNRLLNFIARLHAYFAIYNYTHLCHRISKTDDKKHKHTFPTLKAMISIHNSKINDVLTDKKTTRYFTPF